MWEALTQPVLQTYSLTTFPISFPKQHHSTTSAWRRCCNYLKQPLNPLTLHLNILHNMKNRTNKTEVLQSRPIQNPLIHKVSRKTWVRVVGLRYWTSLKLQNAAIENQYHRIIALVKTHHMKYADVYFERDYKHDATEGYLTMHCFLTPNFYILLECGLDLVYRVEYSFFNYTYETEVMKLLTHYPICLRNKQVELTPDHLTFYQRTLEFQDSKFVYCFKG